MGSVPFTFLPIVHKGPNLSIFSPTFVIFYVFDSGCPNRHEIVSYYNLTCISLIISDAEFLCTCLLVFVYFLWKSVHSSLCPFFSWIIYFLLL